MLAFLLLDKEVEGTHILVDGQWFRIPVKPNDSFLIMMGDVGEVCKSFFLTSNRYWFYILVY
ncbi:hypothetical protein LINPERPRIM_LOCUS7666 [Linum perenne]